MRYYINKILSGKSFDEAIKLVTEELKKEGFGVISEINFSETFKNKLNVDFKKYKVLGACSPDHAYRALKSEDKIGLMLPCNVVVEEHENGDVEVSVIDPIASMGAIQNETVAGIAIEIQQKLKTVINNL